MKSMRNIAAAIVMVTGLGVSTTFAGDGIVIGGKDGIVIGGKVKAEQTTKSNGCVQTSKTNAGILVGELTGIVIGGFTGIVIGGFTGIVIGGATGNGQMNCGIVIGG